MAAVYTEAILECLPAEVLELAGMPAKIWRSNVLCRGICSLQFVEMRSSTLLSKEPLLVKELFFTVTSCWSTNPQKSRVHKTTLSSWYDNLYWQWDIDESMQRNQEICCHVASPRIMLPCSGRSHGCPFLYSLVFMGGGFGSVEGWWCGVEKSLFSSFSYVGNFWLCSPFSL